LPGNRRLHTGAVTARGNNFHLAKNTHNLQSPRRSRIYWQKMLDPDVTLLLALIFFARPQIHHVWLVKILQ
jgi:hypothetical protein